MKHEVLALPQKTRSVTRVTIDPVDLTEYAKCEQILAAAIAANPSLLRDTSFQCLSEVRHAGLCKIKPAIIWISDFFKSHPNEKLVVFAHHRAVREAITEAFPHAIVLDTETKDRAAQVELFQSAPEHRLFITSPRIAA
jgi:hypothetical protein